SITEETREVLHRAQAVAADVEVTTGVADTTPAHSELMARVDEAQKEGDWVKAKILLEEIREMRKANPSQEAVSGQPATSLEDPYILQRLALATYKSQYPTPEEAFKAARDVLKLLEPQTSNDTETLGLWGSLHKGLWKLTKESSYLDEAVRAYERGFYLRNDYYNGINYAYLLNERAAHSAGLARAKPDKAATHWAAAIADFVQAQRVRREVLSICEQWLAANLPPDEGKASPEAKSAHLENKYWVVATQAEAYLGTGETEKAEQAYQEAYA